MENEYESNDQEKIIDFVLLITTIICHNNEAARKNILKTYFVAACG
jgi:hypothetical protein